MIETAVRSLLMADPVVSGLVGARIYSGVPAQRPTFPYITIHEIDTVSDLTLGGDAVGPNTMRVQVDCWAQAGAGSAGYDNAKALGQAVNGSDDQSIRGPLHGFRGTRDGLRIKLLKRLVATGPKPDEMDTKIYRVSADYRAHL